MSTDEPRTELPNETHVQEPSDATRLIDDLRHRDGELVARPETPGGPLGTWLVFYYDGEPVAILDYFSGAGFVSDDTEGGTWYANADLLDEPSEAEAIA